MALVKYNRAAKLIIDGLLDMDAGGQDIRVILLQSATGADADHATVTAALTPGGMTELTGAGGYARVALTSESTSQDDTNDRAEADAANVVFSAVSQDAAETVVGHIFYWHNTTDGDSIPLFMDDTPTEYPLTPNGSDITLTIDPEGWLQLS